MIILQGFIVLFCLILIYKIMEIVKGEGSLRDKYFWVSLGALIFFLIFALRI